MSKEKKSFTLPQPLLNLTNQSEALNHCPALPSSLKNGQVHLHLFPLASSVSLKLLTQKASGSFFEPKTYNELHSFSKNFSIKDKSIIEQTKEKIIKSGGYNGLQFFYKNIFFSKKEKNITIETDKTDYATMKSVSKLENKMQEHRTGSLTPCYSISSDNPTSYNYLATEFELGEGLPATEDFCTKTIELAVHQRQDKIGHWSHPGGFMQWITDSTANKLLYDPKGIFDNIYQKTAVSELVEEALLKPLANVHESIDDQITAGIEELMCNKQIPPKYLVAHPIKNPELALMILRNNSPNSRSQSLEFFYPTLFKSEDLFKLNNSAAPDAKEHKDFKILPIAHLTPMMELLRLSDDFREFSKTAHGSFLYAAGAAAVLQNEGLLNHKMMEEISEIISTSPGEHSGDFFTPFPH